MIHPQKNLEKERKRNCADCFFFFTFHLDFFFYIQLLFGYLNKINYPRISSVKKCQDSHSVAIRVTSPL